MTSNLIAGYTDVVKSSGNWAKDVSAVGEELMKLGFVIRTEPLSVYTLKREEIFFDVRYKEGRGDGGRTQSLTLEDTNSWVRLSGVQNLTKGETEFKYFIDYRMGIGGEVKKFACPKCPTIFEIERVAKFFSELSSGFRQARLVPVIELDVESYHIVMVKPSEEVAGVSAVIELIYKIQRDKKRKQGVGEVVSFEIKDRTAKREGQEASKIMVNTISDVKTVMRRFTRVNGKSLMCVNPYTDIKHDLKKLEKLEISEILDGE